MSKYIATIEYDCRQALVFDSSFGQGVTGIYKLSGMIEVKFVRKFIIQHHYLPGELSNPNGKRWCLI